MKIQLVQLKVSTRQTTEVVDFSPSVTFIHGPVGTGKSTVARLIDYCFGGRLERTPAIQQEFVAAALVATVGEHTVQFERGAHDTGSVRVTWCGGDNDANSVSAPLDAAPTPIYADDVFNLSDLIFKLADIQPIRVRKSKLDAESPLVRLSFRDLMCYCYLEQDHLDSSFFRMEDPFKKLKSRDAMKFVTGLHSERMNELDIELVKATDEQRTKREAVAQIRAFMSRFDMGTEVDVEAQIGRVTAELRDAITRRQAIEQNRSEQTHFAEPLRQKLRELSNQIGDLRDALVDLEEQMQQKDSLRSELIAAKVKCMRADQAARVLEGVHFQQCPQCGAGLSARGGSCDVCSLCGTPQGTVSREPSFQTEALGRDLNERIDELTDSLSRHRREQAKLQRALQAQTAAELDALLPAILDQAFKGEL